MVTYSNIRSQTLLSAKFISLEVQFLVAYAKKYITLTSSLSPLGSYWILKLSYEIPQNYLALIFWGQKKRAPHTELEWCHISVLDNAARYMVWLEWQSNHHYEFRKRR